MLTLADKVPATSSSPLVHRQSPFGGRNSAQFSHPVLCFSFHAGSHSVPRLRAVRTWSDGGRVGSREAYGSDLIRKPILKESGGIQEEDEDIEAKRSLSEEEEDEEEDEEEEEDEGVDWEDKILEETVPLVGFARMILHSGR